MTRVAFLHTGAVVIPVTAALAARYLPGVEVLNLLDDRIVADLAAGGAAAASVPGRLTHLASDAREAGADVVMFTCSSISGFAGEVSGAAGIPVLRIDEAMADRAVATGSRIAVIATLRTTLAPTVRLIRERAEVAGATPELSEILVEGAFDAVVSGDRDRHDALVAGAIDAAAT
ncbi:MAG TPA: aspartate/glutamate racemase family protein, partial [Arachnia sp.]|nr:aspartate/glutamate racemase family protein [Arachnia sp.]